MLSFTRHQKSQQSNQNFFQSQFKPIIITNKPSESSVNKQKKSLRKVTTSINVQKLIKVLKPQKTSQLIHNNWTSSTTPIPTFDNKLKKDQLAAQQRRLKAELKLEKQLIHQTIIVNEKKIGSKSIKMLKDKDQEIEYLRNMIEKEKQQKRRIDQDYQRKKAEIQRERQQLIDLERRIQKQGIKQKKVIQQIKRISSPEKDNTQIRRPIIKKPLAMSIQPTQSQTLHLKNQQRQSQLHNLITHRQTLLSQPCINYTPTLIPLLSKASYKLISTHVSQIVELLVDQMLEEEVYLLEEIQLKQRALKQQENKKQLIGEYQDMLHQFVHQNQQIGSRIGNYSTMHFADVYKPKHYANTKNNTNFQYDSPNQQIFRKVSLDLDDDHIQQINNRKDRFVRFVSNFDQYKKSNVRMFNDCVEQIIDAAIDKLAKELDKGSGQFVQIVFRNQFN